MMITKKALLISILAGMVAGQLVADGERSWTLSNSLRVGYDDNVYRDQTGRQDSVYVKDILDLAWKASMSDRTDLSLKAQLIGQTDKDSNLYPNLYAALNHAVSPRLLLTLEDMFRYDDRTGDFSGTGNRNDRFNYLYNRVMLGSGYVVDSQTRLQASVANAIERNESDADVYDTTQNSVSLYLARELQPQQTRLTLGVGYADLQYENLDSDFQQLTASAELGHTFNQQWDGVIGTGVDLVDANYINQPDDEFTNPRFNAGLTYSPSPRTRISGTYTYKYQTSNNTNYIGSLNQEIKLGVQHDLTAKIMVQATARMVDRNYENEDWQGSDDPLATPPDADEERMYLAARVSYNVTRNHFLEAGYEYGEVDRNSGDDWEQNKVDIGWRVEI